MDTEIKAAHRGMWIHSLAYHSKFDPLCATCLHVIVARPVALTPG